MLRHSASKRLSLTVRPSSSLAPCLILIAGTVDEMKDPTDPCTLEASERDATVTPFSCTMEKDRIESDGLASQSKQNKTNELTGVLSPPSSTARA